MREITLRVMAVLMIAFLGESVLPEGNMKKYTSVLLSAIVCLSMVSAICGNLRFDIPDFADEIETEINDTFREDVLADYKKRAEDMIEENCGAKPEITVDESGRITHVLFCGKPDNISFLMDQMGVAENEIEFSTK